MPTAKSKKREAVRGTSEVERRSQANVLGATRAARGRDGRPSVFRRGERDADAAHSASIAIAQLRAASSAIAEFVN